VVIPVEMLSVASSVPTSSVPAVQLKSEDAQISKSIMSSESASVVAESDNSASNISAAGSMPQLITAQPQFIVSLQGGPTMEPPVIESDDVLEPKRLRVAEDEWTADS